MNNKRIMQVIALTCLVGVSGSVRCAKSDAPTWADQFLSLFTAKAADVAAGKAGENAYVKMFKKGVDGVESQAKTLGSKITDGYRDLVIKGGNKAAIPCIGGLLALFTWFTCKHILKIKQDSTSIAASLIAGLAPIVAQAILHPANK